MLQEVTRDYAESQLLLADCKRIDASASARAGRRAHDQLRREEQLLRAVAPALELTDEAVDCRPPHRLDRLADRGQRRIGVLHERRVVEADHRDVAGNVAGRGVARP